MTPPRLALLALLGAALLAVATARSAPLFLRDAPSLQYNSKADEGSDPKYRLYLDGIVPIHYDISLEPVFPADAAHADIQTFEGKVIITIEVTKEDIKEITLNAAENIEIKKVTVTDTKDGSDDKDGKEDGGDNPGEGKEKNTKEEQSPNLLSDIDDETDREKYEFVKLTLKTELPIGVYKITIEYTGRFLDEDDEKYMLGFYKSIYTSADSGGEETRRVLLTTQFEPLGARMAYPSFDEPCYKATFNVTFTVPEEYGVIGNTIVDEKYNSFSVDIPMSPYLLAFIVYEKDSFLQTPTIINGDKAYRTWGRKEEIDAGNGALSQETAPKVIAELESYTSIDFPFVKLDQAAIPDFVAGAMENWGLSLYREQYLLFNKNSREADRKRIEEVIAHELAHQWFGNLVTQEWWSSSWLKEGFATYFEYFVTDKLRSKWRMMERLVLEQQFAAFSSDALGSTTPLTDDSVFSFSEIMSLGMTPYSKGSSFLRMLNNLIGEEYFRRAMQYYLHDMQFKSAKPENLLEALKENLNTKNVSEADFEIFFNTWTTKKGYPVINVHRSDKGKVKLSQKRFMLDNSQQPEKYHIPLQLHMDGKDIVGISWLKNSSDSLELTEDLPESSWLLIKNTGYFRVNYMEGNWDHLATHFDTFENLQKASLLDDALNLARANQLNYNIAFKLVRKLKDEIDFVPWAAAFSDLAFLNRMLEQTEEAEDFNEFMLKIIDTVYNEVGFEEEEEGDETNWRAAHRTNVLTWACRSGHKQCIDTAVEKLEAYVKKDEPIDVELKTVVYCYGVKHGDEGLWNALWYKLIRTEDTSERALLISALGCTDHKSTLLMFLEHSIAGIYFRSQDAFSVFSAVYTNPKGVDIALEFLTAHPADVVRSYTTQINGLSNAILGIGQYIYTEEQLEKLQELEDFHYNVQVDETVKLALIVAKLSAENNIQWQKDTKKDVVDALNDNDEHVGAGDDADGRRGGGIGDGGVSGSGVWMGQSMLALLVLAFTAGAVLR